MQSRRPFAPRLSFVAGLAALALVLNTCSAPATALNTKVLTILYTNDEHGWMEGEEPGAGAAEMLGLWVDVEGYSPEKSYLILSGGDMWTGPAISTWFAGESMVEIMNAMGYAAAALGNHEFDFKTEGLVSRRAESDFPFLSANIRLKETGERPDFVVPYIIREVDGLSIGIIGLTTTSTPFTAFPDYVADYHFGAYDSALTEIIPELQAQSPDIIIVISHVCAEELEELRQLAQDLGISVLAGGHCHDIYVNVVANIAVVESGSYYRSYARIDLEFDTDSNELVSTRAVVRTNSGGAADADVNAIILRWRSSLAGDLGEVIGYTSGGIAQHSEDMHNMIPDTWLWKYPQAAVAASNYGGYRAGLPAGDITIEAINGVLPFDNKLVLLEMDGQELIDFATSRGVALGGLTALDNVRHSDGTSVVLDSIYKVVVTDFMYSVYAELADADSIPERTDVNWRDPVIDWIRSIGSSSTQPLEDFLDPAPRRSPAGGN